MAACTATTDTVELLETIILHLPLRDILVLQRVSKQWQAVIQGSRKVKRALFLEPSGDVKLKTYKTPEWRTTQGRIWRGKMLLNPLIRCFSTRDEAKISIGQHDYALPRGTSHPFSLSTASVASYQGMALFHPPVQRILPECGIYGMASYDMIINKNELGVTIGDLAEGVGDGQVDCTDCMMMAMDGAENSLQEIMARCEGQPSFFDAHVQLDCPSMATTGWEVLARSAKTTPEGTAGCRRLRKWLRNAEKGRSA
ncbi:hypothetical protein B0A55_06712 [Friedmanniomyces simplex]|uniref:F-box domain-containing protein n=1 Tax=Friedmanniomyces simplex TaxID=329884 RepID=A0A4U0X5H7_9PEZI|nr:hypothetical protein B0A55_06712 [Friedmanniomyces simplex]